MKRFVVTGMTCSACQAHVEKAVAKVPGVDRVAVSLLTNSMAVEGNAAAGDIVAAVEHAGYGASPMGQEKEGGSLSSAGEALFDRETPKLKRCLLWSAVFLVILMYITMGHTMLQLPLPDFLDGNYMALAITQMLLALIIMSINRAFFISGTRSIRQLAPNMDTLVALGSGVSFLWSLYVVYTMTTLVGNPAALASVYASRLYFESAAMIPALITVGKTLESLSKGRTTDALKGLMKMAPRTALVEQGDTIIEVPVGSIQVGDLFVVRPGGAVPVDAVIVEGETALDESTLTGESIPVDKGAGSLIRAATINQTGFIRARATRVGEDTAFSQIIRMVSDAAATKAPIARIADKVSSIFVPSIIGIAIVVGVVWIALGATTAKALEYAICVLVVSCPCALGLATPVAIMVGNGQGARHGILFKTSEALENTGKLQIIALDKTGTITEGKPEVTGLYPAEGVTEDRLLSVAYGLEYKSEHPLAKAIVTKAEALQIPLANAEEFKILAGHGLTGKISDHAVSGGSAAFMKTKAAIPEPLLQQAGELAEKGETPLFFEENGSVLGIIAEADVIKEDSARAVAALKRMGLEVVMLTGDNEKTAAAIGEKVGVDQVIAGVLPEEKEAVIRALAKRGRTAMVGDGVNDAPALARADMGIAIGRGSDIAIDSADIVLMNSRLSDVAAAIRLSRATVKNIHENLFWAFAYNFILIPIAAGLFPSIPMNPMLGAAAMAISSVTVCLNALRLNLFSLHDSRCDKPIARRAVPAEIIGKDNPAPGRISRENARPNYTYLGTSSKEEVTMKKTVSIKGMSCSHCEMTVKKALEALDGVESATVSHETGEAQITLSKDVSDAAIQKAIEDKDYIFEGIKA